jgi:protein-tyrosine-phosphatase
VHSAGVAALVGAPPFECAQGVAQKFSFDISSNLAQQITPELIRQYDKIFCMETWQAQAVMQMDPRSMQKVVLLGSYHPEGRPLFQIPDPAEFEIPETLYTFQFIKASVEGFFSTLQSRAVQD